MREGEWVEHGCLPHQHMIGGYQHATEFYSTRLYGGLTCREEVNLTFTFLLDDLFLQVLDGLDMSPMERVSLGGSLGFYISDGCRIKGFGFPDGGGASGLSLLDHCGAEGLCLLCGMGTDGSGFFYRPCHLRIILTKLHAQLPDGFLPTGVST